MTMRLPRQPERTQPSGWGSFGLLLGEVLLIAASLYAVLYLIAGEML